MNILEILKIRLKPQYVGWEDQYKAVLGVLGIPFDMPMDDFDLLMEMWKDAQ